MYIFYILLLYVYSLLCILFLETIGLGVFFEKVCPPHGMSPQPVVPGFAGRWGASAQDPFSALKSQPGLPPPQPQPCPQPNTSHPGKGRHPPPHRGHPHRRQQRQPAAARDHRPETLSTTVRPQMGRLMLGCRQVQRWQHFRLRLCGDWNI